MQSLHSREEFGRVSGKAVPLTMTKRLVERWNGGALGIKAKKCYPTSCCSLQTRPTATSTIASLGSRSGERRNRMAGRVPIMGEL